MNSFIRAIYGRCFTQENKHRIGLDFFPSCIIRTARPKKLKILQLFIIRVADHSFKLEQKIGTEIASILSRSDPMLIFLSGNRPFIRNKISRDLHKTLLIFKDASLTIYTSQSYVRLAIRREVTYKWFASLFASSAALFSSLVLFVVVAALFVFDGLHFDLVLGLTHACLHFL